MIGLKEILTSASLFNQLGVYLLMMEWAEWNGELDIYHGDIAFVRNSDVSYWTKKARYIAYAPRLYLACISFNINST